MQKILLSFDQFVDLRVNYISLVLIIAQAIIYFVYYIFPLLLTRRVNYFRSDYSVLGHSVDHQGVLTEINPLYHLIVIYFENYIFFCEMCLLTELRRNLWYKIELCRFRYWLYVYVTTVLSFKCEQIPIYRRHLLGTYHLFYVVIVVLELFQFNFQGISLNLQQTSLSYVFNQSSFLIWVYYFVRKNMRLPGTIGNFFHYANSLFLKFEGLVLLCLNSWF